MTIESYGYNSTWDFESARKVIEGLKAVDGYDEPAILEVITGIGRDLFIALDEKPGWFDGQYFNHDWHWKLRRARNGAEGFLEAINA